MDRKMWYDRGKLICLFLWLGACLTACSHIPAEQFNEWTPMTSREGVYVILPANYSLYVGDGLMFESSGSAEDLPVYRTREEAENVLRDIEVLADGVPNFWRVFQLEADWESDVIPMGTEYRLTRPAKIFSVEDLPTTPRLRVKHSGKLPIPRAQTFEEHA